MWNTKVPLFSLLVLLLQVSHPVPATGLSDASRTGTAAEVNPDANGNYHIGNGMSAPKILYAPEPEPTAEARQRHIKRTDVVLLVVAEDGTQKDVHVARSTGEDLRPEDKQKAQTVQTLSLVFDHRSGGRALT